MKTLFITAIAACALTACSVDPQAAADRRQALIQNTFPDPADQSGLHLVFPLESGGFNSTLEIIYFPGVVSDSAVMNRADRYCARYKSETVPGKAFVRKPAKDITATLADGSSRKARQIWVTCFDRS